ncbi:bifunctional phosphopantothenoylcysteine decarboxylase/phosphopantothenate--cysteine ligase CoaBC [Spirosoma luteolum]
MNGKRILLGVTGSIAAYKAALLVRLLVKAGAEVQVIMTDAAQAFISPLTLATLAKRPVLTRFVANATTGEWTNHVDLGLWADALIIAPASAHTLARCANGLSDDLLSAVYLSARCPVFFAPAMDLDMYQHPATLANLARLESYGNHLIRAEYGELASGLVGEGRLAEPETIVEALERHFARRPELVGRSILITAGPTQEPIDPVRYISNHSTGKMGYAIARAFARAGAQVTLVSGPTALPLPAPGVRRVDVRSARDMFDATEVAFPTADVVILNAAVADYTPLHVADRKIKKKETEFALELTRTTDIAATLGARKQPHQRLMGFALETDNERANALDKLQRKHLDWIVLNSLRDAGAGFGYDTNKITVMDKAGQTHAFDLKSKEAVAQDLLNLIADSLMPNV